MSLQGSIESFALPDVLVLLSSTKKDGELHVVGGRVDGRVWLEKGQIVHSALGKKETSAVDAIFELLRLDAGTFSFDADTPAPQRSEPQMIDLVLADAQVRLGEWNDIARVVPHLDAVVDMATEAPDDEIVVTADHWRMLRAVAGGRSVHDLMETIGRSEFDTCKAVKELVDAKLVSIDLHSPAKPAANAKPAEPKPAEAKAPEAKPAPVEDKPSLRRTEPENELEALAELASRPRKVRSTTSATGSTGDQDAARAVSATKLPPAAPDEARALVAQLAALGVDDEDEVAQKVAEHLASGGELPEVPDGDEPINRGLLLKFLSSVRN
ncbi:MAG: resuscitation-promoting factor RpfA [Actinomycetota bacterium]|nr:resuscitation-promoting factor RpfA [Actinomycetota bacterium]